MVDYQQPDEEQVGALRASLNAGSLVLPRQLNVSERLDAQINDLESRLHQLRRLREKLDANPDVRDLVNELRSAGF